VIDIEISAATPSIPGVTFDRLDILGELFFGGGPTGTLRVTLLGDLPALGTEFVIITYNQHDAGGFADIQGLDLGNGFFFEPHFDPQSFSVVLVPAPGAAAGLILTAGLAGISRRRRAA
jgi:hypothetical protein